MELLTGGKTVIFHRWYTYIENSKESINRYFKLWVWQGVWSKDQYAKINYIYIYQPQRVNGLYPSTMATTIKKGLNKCHKKYARLLRINYRMLLKDSKEELNK